MNFKKQSYEKSLSYSLCHAHIKQALMQKEAVSGGFWCGLCVFSPVLFSDCGYLIYMSVN